MVASAMASSLCRPPASTPSSKDSSQKSTVAAVVLQSNSTTISTTTSSSSTTIGSSTTSKIPDCMPGTPSRWFFSAEHLQKTNPSMKMGIDLEKELYYRQQTASFIYELGIKLQLTHLVMNVAMVYMHRFYTFHSFRRFPRNDVAAACIFLAAKVEESPRKLEYIVKVAHVLQHRDDPPLDTKSTRYNDEAQKIVTYENILLQTLGFELTVAVPNQYVVKCIQMVKAPKELAQAAYHFTNDCLHLTTLCLRYRPAVVACASIFLACSWAKWEIPTSHEGKPWYYYVDNEVTKEILEALAEEIVSVYQKCPDRLKIKRYLTVKREAGTSGGASTSAEGGVAGEEIQEPSSLYNSITASINAGGHANTVVATSTTTATSSSTQPSKVKIEVEFPNAQKVDSVANTDAAIASKSHHQQPFGETTTPTGGAGGDKKPKPEAAKVVDFKAYMEKMKDRRPDQQAKNAADSPSTARKSFMPDVSTTTTTTTAASKEMDDARRRHEHQQQHRTEDRHGRHRGGNHEPDYRSNSSHHRPSSASSNRHNEPPGSAVASSKPSVDPNNRQYSERAGNDGGYRKRPPNVDNDNDDRERKVVKTDAHNGGNAAKP